MEIVEFLRARLDEDEAAIYRWDSDARCLVATVWTGDEPGYTTVASSHDGECWIADGHEVMASRQPHVLFDPARVLREVEAQRRIVDEIERELADDSTNETAKYLGLTLAAIYSDHPDYEATNETAEYLGL